MTNREIAQALFVTVRTVQVHLQHAYRKLGTDSRTDLRPRFGEPRNSRIRAARPRAPNRPAVVRVNPGQEPR